MKKSKSHHDTASAPFQDNLLYKYSINSAQARSQKKILSALLTGRKMSGIEMASELMIAHPQSAIRYLRDAGVPISDYWVKSLHSRYKVYFIHQLDQV